MFCRKQGESVGREKKRKRLETERCFFLVVLSNSLETTRKNETLKRKMLREKTAPGTVNEKKGSERIASYQFLRPF